MDAGNDDVFIVGTVEYADIPAAWKGFVNAPHVIVVLFLFGRLLEGNDVDPVRIEMREYVLDCAVLAGSVHRLQDDDEPVSALREKLRLQQADFIKCLRECIVLHGTLVHILIAVRGELLKVDRIAFLDAVSIDVNFYFRILVVFYVFDFFDIIYFGLSFCLVLHDRFPLYILFCCFSFPCFPSMPSRKASSGFLPVPSRPPGR